MDTKHNLMETKNKGSPLTNPFIDGMDTNMSICVTHVKVEISEETDIEREEWGNSENDRSERITDREYRNTEVLHNVHGTRDGLINVDNIKQEVLEEQTDIEYNGFIGKVDIKQELTEEVDAERDEPAAGVALDKELLGGGHLIEIEVSMGEDVLTQGEASSATNIKIEGTKDVARTDTCSLADKKRYACEICQRRFNVKAHLNNHVRTHTGEKPFECEICQRRFALKDTLNNHVKIHTGEKSFECEICHRRFNVNSTLRKHLITHSTEKPFECEVCHRRFVVKSILNKHMRSHTGEKYFECDICHRKFAEKGNLNTHIRTHTGVKPFECEICHQRFTVKCHLTTHMRIHTGEKPYECQICQRRFSQQSTLNVHVRTHNKPKPFECIFCHRKYALKVTLDNHTKAQHIKKNNIAQTSANQPLL